MRIKKDVSEISIQNVAKIGDGKYKAPFGKIPSYRLWISIIGRCYNESFIKRFPCYRDCFVCEEWLVYQNFALWYDENYKLDYVKWCLDKDILCEECKEYSPDNCVFVPSEVNLIMKALRKKDSGVYIVRGKFRAVCGGKRLGTFEKLEDANKAYQTEKLIQIKVVAKKFKNVLDERVYLKMINFKF